MPKGQLEEDIERFLKNETGKVVCCAHDCQQRFFGILLKEQKQNVWARPHNVVVVSEADSYHIP